MPDFFEQPILNSPYSEPTQHWELLEDGQPTQRILGKRRPSSYLSPIPRPKNAYSGQMALDLGEVSHKDDKYAISDQINEVRAMVGRWRKLPREKWNVTPETARLLDHWRNHQFASIRPFFCQIEAVETLIWLMEVAPETAEGKRILDRINETSAYANRDLLRFALKMATGSGKTTVMAMIIAWQTINAIRHPQSPRFTKGFLVVAPGITVRDRLRVLQPNDPDAYYQKRELVPMDMMPEVKQARIVITNYQAFIRRERMDVAAGTRKLLEGRTSEEEFNTLETEGQMLQRVLPELMGMKRILVLNDEAHHCYSQNPKAGTADEADEEKEVLKDKEDKAEAEKNNEAALVWISGLEAIKKRLNLLRIVDLSATPFFLQGSGYKEGTLFHWTVSDFSLMDAIECGIVKLPRVPVAENIPSSDLPIYRNIWRNVRDKMPRTTRSRVNMADFLKLPSELETALNTLYSHYEKTSALWEESGAQVPPCFIVVCQNTGISGLIYKYLAGGFIDPDNQTSFQQGRMKLFRNYEDDGTPKAQPQTILIDSEQLDSGDALSPEFLASAQDEIARFKREIVERTGDARKAENLKNEDILREVMNTVGKPGTLGGGIRCVVSVSMLTEGWDANTVTHIFGLRAFGTQLLCEQVIGRALRRQSYDLNDNGLFTAEYADIFGVPFDFAGKPVVSAPQKPADIVDVMAIRPERDACEIKFPRVEGYCTPLQTMRLIAKFSDDSVLELTPEFTGPTRTQNAGIIGAEVDMTIDNLKTMRKATVAFHLTKYLTEHYLRENGKQFPAALFGQAHKIVNDWLDQYLVCSGGTFPGMLTYSLLANNACEKILNAIIAENDDQPIRAVLSPYNPIGSTANVHFITSRKHRWKTDPTKCHLNWAICDSNWEVLYCQQFEKDDRVKAYVRNHALGFEVPYQYMGTPHSYLPDFIVVIDKGDGPVNYVVEIKGEKDDRDQAKHDTMLNKWIPGVNNLQSFGRWEFIQIEKLYEELDWEFPTDDQEEIF